MTGTETEMTVTHGTTRRPDRERAAILWPEATTWAIDEMVLDPPAVDIHDAAEADGRMSLRDLQAFEKQVVGCVGGSWSPRRGIAELADLYGRGRLPLDRLVTARYPLDGIATGCAAQAAGANLRGIVLSQSAGGQEDRS